MINRLGDSLDFQSQALMLRSERQRLLASNIANADTPGYVARDMDFTAALREATGSGPAALQALRAGLSGLPGQGGVAGEAHLRYAAPSQSNLDGNSVDMDRERATFADNSLKYEATLRFINGHVRTMLDAMKSHQQGWESIMSMFKIFDVSGSAVSAQSQRLNVVASNLANADTVAGPDGKAYKARHVVFQTELMGELGAAGVRVSGVGEDNTAGRRVHDPKHPGADAEGYVTYSNVNTVEEMVNMISASRSYQNNLEVMNAAKSLLLKTLQMGQS